ncbi:hypothetical protein G7046_g8070 [Stylonectria norvegica]|nr:hypothetical protein G7046_g8070 [Stylonectria norvegica]
MRLAKQLHIPSATISTILLLLLFLILHVVATPTAGYTSASILRRAETAGASCDSEGQWNCMTSSWQRCASGRWSVEMQCAAGTKCTPSGHTDDFRIENDGSAHGEGTSGGSASMGPKGSMSRAIVLFIAGFWVSMVIWDY